MKRFQLRRTMVLVAIGLLTCLPVFGQYLEIEPNQPCSEAQRLNAGLNDLPLEVAGEVTQDANSDPPGDIDYFHFQANAGTLLRAELLAGEATSSLGFVPYLGLFDEHCSALDFNSYYFALDARIDFTVPGSGQLILGVTSVTDPGWGGQHGQGGFYTLRLAEPAAPIGGITGRIVDAVTGDPLVGGGPTWPSVTLYRCTDGDCNTPVINRNADPYGQFMIDSGELGPLDPGQYLLQAFAVQYETEFIGPFAVQSGEVKDLGDIALEPPTFAFGAVFPCAQLGPEGGLCSYSVNFNNNSDSGLFVRSWSLVEAVSADPEGFLIPFLEFPAYPRFRTDWVEARSTFTLHFSFNVPAATPDHLYAICPQALAADAATRFTGILSWTHLLCVIKQREGFDVRSREEVMRLDALRAWWLGAEMQQARAAEETAE